jgi:acyl-CoA reductase-like NAD-dependent aldehyde dehydrogenase
MPPGYLPVGGLLSGFFGGLSGHQGALRSVFLLRAGLTKESFIATGVTDVAEGVRLVDEEQFGPALPLLTYRDVDDAVERANATSFGLSGSVWSSDVARASEVAGRLVCGTAWVNKHVDIVPHAPFGGAKWSGIGVENGPWGLLGFTELQTINVAKEATERPIVG